MSAYPTISSSSSSSSSSMGIHRSAQHTRSAEFSTLSKVTKVALYAISIIASFALLPYPLPLIVSAIIIYIAMNNKKRDDSQPIFIPYNTPPTDRFWYPAFWKTTEPVISQSEPRSRWFNWPSSSSRVPVGTGQSTPLKSKTTTYREQRDSPSRVPVGTGQITQLKKPTVYRNERIVKRSDQEETSSSRSTRIPVGERRMERRG